MSWPFSKPQKAGDKPKKTSRRRSSQETLELKEKRIELKRKELEYDKFVKIVKDDPEVEREIVAKAFGLNIKTIDPTEKKKKEIEALIVERALEKIRSDPELSEKFVDIQVSKIVGDAGEQTEVGEGVSIIRQIIEERQDWEELEQMMGGGNKSFLGTLAGLLTPESIEAIGRILKQGSAPRTYVVEIGGQLRELNEAEYYRFMEQRKSLVAAPDAVTSAEEPVVEGKPADPVEHFLTGIDLGALVDEALHEDPAVYAQLIYGQAQEGHERAKLLWQLLSKTPYELIVSFLHQHENHAKYGAYIHKVLDSDENLLWLQRLVETVREMQSSGGRG